LYIAAAALSVSLWRIFFLFLDALFSPIPETHLKPYLKK
jgi:hypothetical protein